MICLNLLLIVASGAAVVRLISFYAIGSGIPATGIPTHGTAFFVTPAILVTAAHNMRYGRR